MATPRDIRRLALLALYQLDARGMADAESIRASLDDADEIPAEAEPFRPRDFDKAFELAVAAFGARADSDRLLLELAPEWPPHRQAAIDRAILRLSIYELTQGKVPPKASINEAVELARTFSTDKSPTFINGVLAAALKRLTTTARTED